MTKKEYYKSLVQDALTALTAITFVASLVADITDGHLTATALLLVSTLTGALKLITK